MTDWGGYPPGLRGKHETMSAPHLFNEQSYIRLSGIAAPCAADSGFQQIRPTISPNSRSEVEDEVPVGCG